jgi:hypothetical protein
MNSTAIKLTSAVKEEWIKRHADLLACLTEPPIRIFERITATLYLDQSIAVKLEGIIAELSSPDESIRGLAEIKYHNTLFSAFSKAFIKCYSNNAIEFAVQPTTEAACTQTAALDEEANEVNFFVSEAIRALTPKATPLTPAQRLTNEVLEDWRGVKDGKKWIKQPLSIREMAEKKRTRRDYRAEFERLGATDALDSQITTAYSGSDMIGG